MIHSKDNKSWIIATPSKTGTNSLLKGLIPSLGVYKKGLHSMDYCEQFKKRILIIREPLERYASTFWFIKQNEHRKSFWVPFRGHTKDINSFTKEYIRKRKESGNRNLWTRSLVNMAEQFNPTHIVKVELGYEQLYKLIGSEFDIPHAFKTKIKSDWKTTSKDLLPELKKELITMLKDELTFYKK